MNIHDTIERALKSAGLNPRSGSLHGVGETIRQALASAGLGGDGQAARPGRSPVDVHTSERNTPGAGLETPAGQFIARSHASPAGTRDYKLYVPAQPVGKARGPMPLLVMLHGCTQSADDFAAGTQMNRLAEAHGFLVVYPEQATGANPSRCWNWFRAADQVGQGGEPALIAGITRAVLAEHPVDPCRIYVAGLSAGAAMAVIMGETCPELFAAVGVHSGLPYAAAHDIPSAMAAMKGHGVMGRSHLPGTPDDPRRQTTRAVPTIVFHGDLDQTVEPGNATRIVQQATRAHAVQTPLSATTEQGTAAGGRRYTRTVHADASGLPRVESWTLHGMGHAWSGGSGHGSYTDSHGPDASAEMLRFFVAHPGRCSA